VERKVMSVSSSGMIQQGFYYYLIKGLLISSAKMKHLKIIVQRQSEMVEE
jgi:hypothetical protein